MLLEGYYLYKTTVLCLHSNFNKLLLYAIGYGIPLVICIVGFFFIWVKENVLFEALFDERNNYL
jgi:hypothetical protein